MSRTASVLLAASAALGPILAAPEAAEAMSTYRWKNRPLFVFAPSTASPDFVRQQAALAGRSAGLRERDMVVIAVIGDRVTARFGRTPGLSAAAMRRRYGVPDGAFRAVLVGKDGGVKISAGSPISTRRLFSTIDAMPMRRQEMRRR